MTLGRDEVSRHDFLIFLANCRSHVVGALRYAPTIPDGMTNELAREDYAMVRRDVIDSWPSILEIRRESRH